MDFLVTNNTTEWNDKYQLINVLFGRKPNGERVRVDVTGLDPYFYAPESEIRDDETNLLSNDSVKALDYGHESLFGDEVARVVTDKPKSKRQLAGRFSETFEADVWFEQRFRIDSGVRAWAAVPASSRVAENRYAVSIEELQPLDSDEVEHDDPDPRITTFDIETDDRGDGFPSHGEERILSVVAHDSREDEYVGFIDLHGKPVGEAFPDGRPNGVDELRYFSNEKNMLQDFGVWIVAHDPDLLTGWNSQDFDIPYLVARMEEVGLDANKLSPVGYADVSRGSATIGGRAVYDTLTAYKRNSHGELRKHTLDYIAGEELGEAKLEHEEGFYELYESNPARLVEYNARDTRLTVGIDREAGVIQFRDALRKLAGVDWEDTLESNDFVEMITRRMLYDWDMVGPTASHQSDGDYGGGYVFDPYSGVADNVVEIDLASLYPMTMKMLNLSPEMKVPDGGDEGGQPRPRYTAANGVQYYSDEDGLFQALVDEAMGFAATYKERRNNASSDEEREKWGEFYAAAKAVRNSLYGVLGWEHFFLYDKDTAEAITQSGQQAIKSAAGFVEDDGFDVIYGDSVPGFEPVYVNTEHGADVVPIEEIFERFNRGEDFEVWNDGGWTELNDAIRKPNRKDMYRVRTGNGMVHVTEDHGLLLEDGTEVPPTEIEEGDALMHTDTQSAFDEATADQLSDDKAWLLGLFVADGTCNEYETDNGATVQIKRQWKISKDNTGLLEEAQEKVESTMDVNTKIEYGDSEKFTGRLRPHGQAEYLEPIVDEYRELCYTGDGKKKVPAPVLNGTDEVKESFLAGYQAGDGDDDPRYTKTFHRSYTNSHTLAAGIGTLLRSLDQGMGVNCRDNHGKEYPRIWSRKTYTQTNNEVLSVEQVDYTGEYVYDLSTDSEHFNAGVGTITVHNTDSCYICFGSDYTRDTALWQASWLVGDINNWVYPEKIEDFGVAPGDNLWELELESYSKRFFQAGKKKRYAKLLTWEDGATLDEPSYSISGFGSQRSDSSELSKETEERVIRMILDGEPDGDIVAVVSDAASAIDPSSPQYERIGIPGGFGQPFHEYDTPGAHVRGAQYANKLCELDLGEGDKPMRCYLKSGPVVDGEPVDVISYENESDLEPITDEIIMDAQKMIEKTLRKPLDRILGPIGLNAGAAISGHEQTGLGAF